jgi:hypothetical protein
MASPAQCFYCFETLAASYKDEEPPSLTAIESSYWNFIQSKQLATVEDKAWVLLILDLTSRDIQN